MLQNQHEKVALAGSFENTSQLSWHFLYIRTKPQVLPVTPKREEKSLELLFTIISSSRRKFYKNSDYKYSSRPQICFDACGNAPKDVHILILGLVLMLPYMARETLQLQLIKESWDGTWWERSWKMICSWLENGERHHQCRRPLEVRKTRKAFSSRASRRNAVLLAPWFSPWRPISVLTTRTKRYCLFCFKPPFMVINDSNNRTVIQ